jgi:phage host-nuclease inhibitor protein Gam
MTAVKAPKNAAQATALLERYAALVDDVATIEARRNRMIARANAAADAKMAPLAAEAQAVALKVEPWWRANAAELGGKRKSIELGGCMIGTRSSRPQLQHSHETDEKAVEALRGTRYAKQGVRVSYSLYKTGVQLLLGVGGRTAAALGELGFSIKAGTDEFFVKRAEQAGTIAGAK